MLPAIKAIKLKVLVFGPNPATPYPPGFEADLSKKRLEIKNALISEGHDAAFPEDLWKGVSDPTIDNPYIWEKSLVLEYDVIVNLVGTFGSVDELSLFHKQEVAAKAALFFSQNHTGGLPYAHARALVHAGATLQTYTYPVDLTSCNLLTQVAAKVESVRIAKFLTA